MIKILLPGILLPLCSFLCSLSAGGFQVMGTDLLDSTGKPFVMRGVNIPHCWFPEKTDRVLKEARDLGCNTVRLVFASGYRWEITPKEEIVAVLDRCRELGLVAVVEVHDATGFSEIEEAAPLFTVVEYWIDMKPALDGREDYVILNIANEPFGNQVGEMVWLREHADAIQRLREADFHHTLMVDAANWGQDWSRISLKQAPRLLEADSRRNTVFSVHMYEVYGNPDIVHSYLQGFRENDLCLVVGEFADSHYEKPVAARTILERCAEWDIGYLGWSWSGNNPETAALDIVIDWDASRLSPWGELLFKSQYGIQATSRPVGRIPAD